MWVKPRKRAVATPVFKAESDNPLVRAMQNRTPAERVRTSVSRLTERERQIYQSVQDAVNALVRSADSAFVRRLIAEGVERVLNGISVSQFISELQPMVDAIQQEVVRAGASHIPQLPNNVGAQMRFDYLDPRAVAWANERAGELVGTLVDDQRNVLRNVISQGIQDQVTVDEMARNVREVIGLPEGWANAVPKARAAEFARQIAAGKSIAQATLAADKLADRYKARLVNARAKTIARTEIMTAQNQGRWLSWAQGVEQGFLPRKARKEWIAAPGFGPAPKLCEICAELDGEVADWDKAFPGTDVMMPPLHPNCRCTAVVVPFDVEELRVAVEIPQSDYELADEYVQRVRSVEPEVTKEIQETAARMGGKPVGLEFRIKSRNSFARKMYTDAVNGDPPIPTRKAADNIKDALRYTIEVPADRYGVEVRNYLMRLQQEGVEFRSKIRWRHPDIYRGVNLQIRDPRSGQWYELQFHTPDSLRGKGQLHEMFERYRVLPDSDPAKKRLFQDMVDRAAKIPDPADVERLVGLMF